MPPQNTLPCLWQKAAERCQKMMPQKSIPIKHSPTPTFCFSKQAEMATSVTSECAIVCHKSCSSCLSDWLDNGIDNLELQQYAVVAWRPAQAELKCFWLNFVLGQPHTVLYKCWQWIQDQEMWLLSAESCLWCHPYLISIFFILLLSLKAFS